jgi:hypothetical protein
MMANSTKPTATINAPMMRNGSKNGLPHSVPVMPMASTMTPISATT